MPEMDRSVDPPGPDPLVGTLVDGRYTIERPLAAGGMGSVYLARQKNLARPVAVKVVTNADDDLIERFRREAEALAEVSHPAIVEVHDFIGTEAGDGRCYLVMSYVEGENLEDYLERVPGGCVGAAEAVSLLIPIVSALVQLHASGIVHRDIKPANIIRFQGADGRPAVKLVDFGIARRAVDTNLTSAGYIIGTPPYMAPETLMAKPHTPLADVYALGATFFELLTGSPPHGRGALHEIMAHALREEAVVPPDLQSTSLGDLLGHMLQCDERRRPDALQALDALERVQDELAALRVAGRPSTTAPHATPGALTPNRLASTVQIVRDSSAAGPSTQGAAQPPPQSRPGVPATTGETDPRHSGPLPVGQPHPVATAPTALAPGLSRSSSPLLGATASRTPSPAMTASTLAPPPRPRRSIWIWLGPLLAVPVFIAVVAIALVVGRGDSNPKAPIAGGRAPSGSAGADPQGMVRQRPLAGSKTGTQGSESASQAAETGAAGVSLVKGMSGKEAITTAAKVGELLATCRSRDDARRLYERAKGLRSSKRSEHRQEAIALYQAVLRCAHSDSGQRRWSAFGLSTIFRGQGDCVSARTHWNTYRDLSLRAGQRYRRFPPCR